MKYTRPRLDKTLAAIIFLVLWPSTSFSPLWSSNVLHHVHKMKRMVPLFQSSSRIVEIEGLTGTQDFDRLCNVDQTLETLKTQLPLTLTKPLTAVSADKVYEKDAKLTVMLVPNSNNGNGNGDDDEQGGEIGLLQSREELVSLSDVIVLAITAAQQANSVLSGRGNNNNSSSMMVQCQLVLDQHSNTIRIPWKANVPILGSPTSNNRLEGLSEFVLDDSSGKVQTHRIRNVTFNNQVLNGPAIGQALRAMQAAVANLQQNPLVKPFLFPTGTTGGSNVWNDLRDGLLEQAATAASSRVSSSQSKAVTTTPVIIQVASIEKVNGWVDMKDIVMNIPHNDSSLVPFPGSPEWKKYATAHVCLERFCDEVIPILSGANPTRSTVEPSLFDANVVFSAVDNGPILLTGDKNVANFYESLALARRGTGGFWKMKRCSVLNWRNRSIEVDYEAANNLPPWTIQGSDIYTLSPTEEGKPVIQRIQQVSFSATTPDGGVSMDTKWLMKNMVNIIERGRSTGGGNVRDALSDLLLQQMSRGQPSKKLAAKSRPRLSQSSAANVYYVMADVHERAKNLLNATSGRFPPAAEYMTENVELRGYLGETLVRGSTIYSRAIGAILSSVQQSIVQKRLVVEKTVPPRVELTDKGAVRLSLTFFFRLPTPSVPGLIPDSAIIGGVPLKFELVTDYIVNEDSGLIDHQRLVETRVNGQLTPGDVLSRLVQRFLRLEESSSTAIYGNDDILKSFSDALTWFRTLSGSGGVN